MLSRWRCDVCSIAIFNTYEEALEHERQCKVGPSDHSDGSSFSVDDEMKEEPQSPTKSTNKDVPLNPALSETESLNPSSPSVTTETFEGSQQSSRADDGKVNSTNGSEDDRSIKDETPQPDNALLGTAFRRSKTYWKCDFCYAAVSDDYNVCLEHEKQCPSNPNKTGNIIVASSKRAKLTLDAEVEVSDNAIARECKSLKWEGDDHERLTSEMSPLTPVAEQFVSNKRKAEDEGAIDRAVEGEGTKPDCDNKKLKKPKQQQLTSREGKPPTSGLNANGSNEKDVKTAQTRKGVSSDVETSSYPIRTDPAKLEPVDMQKQAPSMTRVDSNIKGRTCTDFDKPATSENNAPPLSATKSAVKKGIGGHTTKETQQQTVVCGNTLTAKPSEAKEENRELLRESDCGSAKHDNGNEKSNVHSQQLPCVLAVERSSETRSQCIQVHRFEASNDMDHSSSKDNLRQKMNQESEIHSLKNDGVGKLDHFNPGHQLDAYEDARKADSLTCETPETISKSSHGVSVNYYDNNSEIISAAYNLQASSNGNAETSKPRSQIQRQLSVGINEGMTELKSSADNPLDGLRIPGNKNLVNITDDFNLSSYSEEDIVKIAKGLSGESLEHEKGFVDEDESNDHLERISESEKVEGEIQSTARTDGVKLGPSGKILLFLFAIITVTLFNFQNILPFAPTFGSVTLALIVILLVCTSSFALAMIDTHEGVHHRHARGFVSELANTVQDYMKGSCSFSQTSENTTKITLREYLLHPDGFHASFAPAFFGFYCYFGCLAGLEEETGGLIVPAPLSTDGSVKDCRLISVAGASAGAMAAVMLAAGIQPRKAAEFSCRITWRTVADPPGIGGFVKGERFEEIMREFILENARIDINPHDSTNEVGGVNYIRLEESLIPVAVSGFDLFRMKGKLLTRGCMAKAARSSACFPSLFAPVPWREDCDDSKGSSFLPDSLLIDGGITDGLGLWGLSATPSTPDKRKRVINFIVGDFGYKGASGIAEMPDGVNAESLVSIAVMNTPLCGPWAMENGPKAVDAARRAIIAALDTPMERGTCDNHYVLRVDASKYLSNE